MTEGIEYKFEKNSKRVQKYSFGFSKTHISDSLMSCYKAFSESVDFKGMGNNCLSDDKSLMLQRIEQSCILCLRGSDNQGVLIEKVELLNSTYVSGL